MGRNPLPLPPFYLQQVGLSIILALVLTYLVNSWLVPADIFSTMGGFFGQGLSFLALFFLIFQFSKPLWGQFSRASISQRWTAVILATGLSALHASSLSWNTWRLAEIIAIMVVLICYILLLVRLCHQFLKEMDIRKFISGSIFSVGLAFILNPILKLVYHSDLAVILLTIVGSNVTGILFGRFWQYWWDTSRKNKQNGIIGAVVFITLYAAWITVMVLSLRFPDLFPVDNFTLTPVKSFIILLPAITGIATLPAVHYQLKRLFHKLSPAIKGHIQRVLEMIPALGIGSLFLVLYFLLALSFNQPDRKLIDTYFDADNSIWMRIWGGMDQDVTLRSTHPYAFLLVRPFVWMASLVLNQNGHYGVLFINSLFGAGCVILFWLIIRKFSADDGFALLTAAIFGCSTTQLFFSSNVETYIFSAFGLLLFVWVLLQNLSLKYQVLVGAGIFGITITNILQTAILHLTSKRSIRQVVKYTLWISAIGILLTYINHLLYRNSGFFFIPSSILWETTYVFSPLDMPVWKGIGKIILMIRSILLYSTVAPIPLVQLDPNRDPMLLFFLISIQHFSFSEYEGLGTALVVFWAGLLTVAGIGLVQRFISRKAFSSIEVQYSTGFILCIVFNFLFHTIYGYEPFLYSADWMYALLLLLSLSWMQFIKYPALKYILAIFFLLLMINNLRFIATTLVIIDTFI